MEQRELDRSAVAAMIDHTELRVDASYADIRRLCLEAEKFRFPVVVVYPVNVPLAAELLDGTGIRIAAVVGFPTGAYTVAGKAFESEDAIAKGAEEIDFVINVGALKGGNYTLVEDELQTIARVTGHTTTKAILETCLLSDEEKATACKLATDAGIDFVKTATGFGAKGATVEDVRLLRRVAGEDVGVTASGGIRTPQDAVALIGAGATRIGTSSGILIIQGLRE
jgi:deoxyribose-phosphate aldolase